MVPDPIGMLPAAALAFRNKCLAQGETVAPGRRAPDDLCQRRSTVLAASPGFDPDRDVTELTPEDEIDLVLRGE